jgi:hypothetical protein
MVYVLTVILKCLIVVFELGEATGKVISVIMAREIAGAHFVT